MRPRAETRGRLWPWAGVAALLAVAWEGGVWGPVPLVEGPLPRFEAAEPALPFAARLPKEWTLWSHPAEVYGVPVFRAPGETEWEVTGRWRPPRRPEGHQAWVQIDYRDWYRLNAEIPPYGPVSVWGLLPGDWIASGARDEIPWAEPAWGEVWDSVPYSDGRVLVPSEGEALELRACPQAACPVLERPLRDQDVPVTGRYEGAGGESWWRVEFRQTILWAQAGSGSVRMKFVGWWLLRAGLIEGAGWRSCEPLVMFPPPPHTTCRVDRRGRYLDEFEREYDRLDPVFGRLPAPEPRQPGGTEGSEGPRAPGG